MLKAAKFNEDHTHRYYLSRIWDDSTSKMLFIGINPSTADGEDDDHTVSRLVNFCKSWGFGGFYIVNLYSFVSPDPDKMIQHYLGLTNKMEKSLHKQNMQVALRYGRICAMTTFMWGASIPNEEQADKYIRTFRDAYCFGKTAHGYPKHPLFLASHTQLIKFR